MTIGEKVKKKIKEQGRTITWVSKQVGVSRSSFSQRISGKLEFKMHELIGISKALGLSEKYNWFD